MWQEACPVPILTLKRAMLEGKLDFEIPSKQFKLTLPLGALMHDKLPELIHKLLARLARVAASCTDHLSESSRTQELISMVGEAMCLIVVLGDTQSVQAVKAQGFHGSTPDRPAPADTVEAAVVSDAPPPPPLPLCSSAASTCRQSRSRDSMAPPLIGLLLPTMWKLQ